MCLFYFSLVTVHQDCTASATPKTCSRAYRPSDEDPRAAMMTSGMSVMMQSAPMPTSALATSGSFTVQTDWNPESEHGHL